jgi:amidase
VHDLAIGLDATIGADPDDPATQILGTAPAPRFVDALDTTALRGVRFGVIASYLGGAPEDEEATGIVRAALEKMRAQGAEVVDVTIPGLDSLVRGASVIDFEFKFDLQDFLARAPNAPVSSLAMILERGMFNPALEQSLRRRDMPTDRNSEAYRAALARREDVRALVVRFMDAERLDALAYPSIRRKPALIGATQPGANCTLSAVTGMPALGIPAGFTADSLPIGLELLGRPLADARLVAFAYDYEQAVHPRRPPRTTPPLSGHRRDALDLDLRVRRH